MEAARTSGRTRNSLCWAVAIPGAATAGGFLAQYPYGMVFVGVLLVLAAAGIGAAVAGTFWNRAGAATVIGFGTLALSLFAGPQLYETYTKLLGEQVPAVVVEVGEHKESDGDTRSYCVVSDPSGQVRKLGQQQNCFGDFTEGQQVVLFEDPAGILDPRIEATGARTVDALGSGITGGLLVLIGGTMFAAGERRRTDAEVGAKRARR
ncbi:hypothetical protein [Streptomyces xanthophaeus]|uniref:Uncharacterized protein n=1 Tax=Streptomyces xanthophaeus TaxID=67385 RepID=A0A919H7T8_9ACTN|nr:hypothetical protein [Streptomyces xanthophaeus]GHI89109.1 hypothetical protein Sxan_64730 [Streptomyces xanthophaeus]